MPQAQAIRWRTTRRAPPRQSTAREATDVEAAVLGGQLAGLAMMGALALAFAFFGEDGHLTRPLAIVASTFVGDLALQEPPSIGHLFFGAVAHQLGFALLWSLVFGVIAARFRARKRLGLSVAIGLAIGALAYVLGVHVIVPALARLFDGNAWDGQVPALWSIAAHLLFGATLGALFPQLGRRVGRGASAQPAL